MNPFEKEKQIVNSKQLNETTKLNNRLDALLDELRAVNNSLKSIKGEKIKYSISVNRNELI